MFRQVTLLWPKKNQHLKLLLIGDPKKRYMFKVSATKYAVISKQDIKIFQKFLESAVNNCKLGHLVQTPKWKLHNFGQTSQDNFHNLKLKWSPSYFVI